MVSSNTKAPLRGRGLRQSSSLGSRSDAEVTSSGTPAASHLRLVTSYNDDGHYCGLEPVWVRVGREVIPLSPRLQRRIRRMAQGGAR
jgi:hypothetical protein